MKHAHPRRIAAFAGMTALFCVGVIAPSKPVHAMTQLRHASRVGSASVQAAVVMFGLAIERDHMLDTLIELIHRKAGSPITDPFPHRNS